MPVRFANRQDQVLCLSSGWNLFGFGQPVSSIRIIFGACFMLGTSFLTTFQSVPLAMPATRESYAFVRRQVASGTLLADDLLRDHHALNLAAAFADLGEFRVSPQLLNEEFEGHPAAAMNLDRSVCDVICGLRSVELGH